MKSNTTIDEDKIFTKFTKSAKKVTVNSYELARRDKQNYEKLIEPKHLFVAILRHQANLAAKLLEKLHVDVEKTAGAIMPDEEEGYHPYSFTPSEQYKRIVAEAFMEAAQLGHVYIGTEHLLLAMMRQTDIPFVKDLVSSGLNYDKFKEELLKFGSYQPGVFARGGSEVHKGPQKPSDGDQPNSALDYFGQSLVDLARLGKFMPVYGRDEEIERIVHILSRKTKNNPILIGEAGVGKTAIVEAIAQRVRSGKVPRQFKNLDIIKLDMSAIIAGAKIRGDVEERLLAIMNEVKKSPDKILFIDEIHTIVSASSAGGAPDIANILKPYLTDGDMQIIGATTQDEYRKFFEEDSALLRRFQPIQVEELDVDSTKKVLGYLKDNFENYHRVQISAEAIEEAAVLSQRYIRDRFNPDKAIDLIDEAAAKIKVDRAAKSTRGDKLSDGLKRLAGEKSEALSAGNLDLASEIRQRELDLEQEIKNFESKQQKLSSRFRVEPEDVRRVISVWTKIPVNSLTAMEIKSVERIEDELERQIVGQTDATSKVAAALKRAKLGFNDERRPLASLLLLGPTGVGKTETAKVVAKEVFGSESNLIQINMSELMEQHSVSKLIGAPPGYVGYSDGNHITERVRKQPYSVVLFDEIEKAHPDTLNVLLQILEEGEVQDSKGRKVNFRNTLVILTSNIGAEQIASDSTLGFAIDFSEVDKTDAEIDEAYDDMRERVLDELKGQLRPEFINRLDEVIVYRGLNEGDMLEIAKLRVEELQSRLGSLHIDLKVTPHVVKLISDEGFSEEYGARNLRRELQDRLETKLADFLLESDLVNEVQKRKASKKDKLPVEAHLSSGEVAFELAETA